MATKKQTKAVPKATPEPKKSEMPVPLKALCSELKVDPRLARRKLRREGVTGHDARTRWTWKPGSEQLKKVRELLKD